MFKHIGKAMKMRIEGKRNELKEKVSEKREEKKITERKETYLRKKEKKMNKTIGRKKKRI